MSDSEPSLVQEYRREYGAGFHPLKLWRDRRAILADPSLAAQPKPPLANSPVRFALSLNLIPVLIIGWTMSLLVDLAYPDRAHSGLYDALTTPAVAVLAAELPGLSHDQVATLARSVKRRDLPAEAQELLETPRSVLQRRMSLDEAQMQAELRAWLRDVHASNLTEPQKQVVIARTLKLAQSMSRSDRVINAFMRSVSEGGPVMQFLTVLSLLLAAWMFGQMVQGNARFVHAARADRFYLYYASSRMFWFLMAQALIYGLTSFGSAAGDASLFRQSQWLSAGLYLASVVYLLWYSPDMARALGAPEGGGYAIAWRVLAALAAAMAVLLILGMVVGFAAGIVVAIMTVSG